MIRNILRVVEISFWRVFRTLKWSEPSIKPKKTPCSNPRLLVHYAGSSAVSKRHASSKKRTPNRQLYISPKWATTFNCPSG